MCVSQRFWAQGENPQNNRKKTKQLMKCLSGSLPKPLAGRRLSLLGDGKGEGTALETQDRKSVV